MAVKRETRVPAMLLMAALDLVAMTFAVAAAFRLKFGVLRDIPAVYLQNQNRYILTAYIILLGMQLLFGCVSYLPAFSVTDSARLLLAVAGTTALLFALDRTLRLGIPVEIMLIHALLLAAALFTTRLSARLWRLWGGSLRGLRKRGGMERALLYGAGEIGRYLSERLAARPEENLRVVGFVDDAPTMRNVRVRRLRVLGGFDALPRILSETRATQLILAAEHFPRARLSQLVAVCRENGCRVRRFGSMEELAENRLEAAAISDIRLEDLLRRDSVQLNQSAVRKFIDGRCVMITGGAGSIGSELCRQVLAMGAGLLVIFDFHENGMYELDNELRALYDPARYRLCVGSVRDGARLAEVLAEFHPSLLFHAAAHKHVPMMELNPREAVKNNVFGTLCAARAAMESGVERFILISTDKAVNPTNVMGATKRIAELCVQMLDKRGETRFAAVRFGNVLGSHGSVVPHFKTQIEHGGPVTVTHPEMRRYFMTIPEAVQLVLEAGGMASGGEIFVLDMGEPVKIFDLACDMIRLSGFAPGRDIPIVFTGIRPGEKLFEELRLAEEDTDKTGSNKIYVNKPIQTDAAALENGLAALEAALGESTAALFAAVGVLVPTFAHTGGGDGA